MTTDNKLQNEKDEMWDKLSTPYAPKYFIGDLDISGMYPHLNLVGGLTGEELEVHAAFVGVGKSVNEDHK